MKAAHAFKRNWEEYLAAWPAQSTTERNKLCMTVRLANSKRKDDNRDLFYSFKPPLSTAAFAQWITCDDKDAYYFLHLVYVHCSLLNIHARLQETPGYDEKYMDLVIGRCEAEARRLQREKGADGQSVNGLESLLGVVSRMRAHTHHSKVMVENYFELMLPTGKRERTPTWLSEKQQLKMWESQDRHDGTYTLP